MILSIYENHKINLPKSHKDIPCDFCPSSCNWEKRGICDQKNTSELKS